jgi:hypothetical protein
VKTLGVVLMEITELTTMMETAYPKLYQFLDENPMTISVTNHPNIDIIALNEYLESLKGLLQ